METRMNPGGRFAPQSNQLVVFEGFGGAVSEQRSDLGWGGVRFPSADCGKNPAKKGDDRHTDKIQSESPKFGTLSRSTDPSRWALLPKIF